MICAAVETLRGNRCRQEVVVGMCDDRTIDGQPRVERQRFGVNVADLKKLREWLSQAAVTHVVMESTGSYWKPIFNVLEDSVKV